MPVTKNWIICVIDNGNIYVIDYASDFHEMQEKLKKYKNAISICIFRG